MDIAGKNIANPTSMLLTSVNMLRAMNLPRFGDLIFRGLWNVYEEGKYLTPDVGGTSTSTQFTDRLIKEVKALDQLKSL